MKKKLGIIATLIMLAIVTSACTTPDLTQDPNYREGTTNPNLSCTTYNGCYIGYQTNNLAGQAPVTVTVIGIPKTGYGSVDYESTDGSRWATLEKALTDSLTATGERKVTMRIPVGNYSLAIMSSDGSADINGIVMPPTWTTPLTVGTGELLVPIDLGTNLETTLNPGTATYTGVKLRKR